MYVGDEKTNIVFIGDGIGKTIITGSHSCDDLYCVNSRTRQLCVSFRHSLTICFHKLSACVCLYVPKQLDELSRDENGSLNHHTVILKRKISLKNPSLPTKCMPRCIHYFFFSNNQDWTEAHE